MSDNGDEHNRSGMFAFLFSMAFVFLFFVYIVAVHPGIDLQENVKDPNAMLADGAEQAVDVSGIAEPWVANADMVKHGKKMYMLNCQTCHGESGKGDGPAGAALNPKPRDLVSGPWKKGGGYIGLFNAITEGLPGTSMAAFAHIKLVDRWAIVQYIDSITNAKVKEDPAKVAAFAKAAK